MFRCLWVGGIRRVQEHLTFALASFFLFFLHFTRASEGNSVGIIVIWFMFTRVHWHGMACARVCVCSVAERPVWNIMQKRIIMPKDDLAEARSYLSACYCF